jgi:hypothetical protein
VLAVCAYPVSADVQIDESVFKITAFSGVITSPDGESASFNSISDFKKLLETPIIAESKVELLADRICLSPDCRDYRKRNAGNII